MHIDILQRVAFSFDKFWITRPHYVRKVTVTLALEAVHMCKDHASPLSVEVSLKIRAERQSPPLA